MAEIFMVLGGLGSLIAFIALIRGEWTMLQVPNRKVAAGLFIFFCGVLAFGLWMGPSPMPDPQAGMILPVNSFLF